jgi:hypothetical protein
MADGSGLCIAAAQAAAAGWNPTDWVAKTRFRQEQDRAGGQTASDEVERSLTVGFTGEDWPAGSTTCPWIVAACSDESLGPPDGAVARLERSAWSGNCVVTHPRYGWRGQLQPHNRAGGRLARAAARSDGSRAAQAAADRGCNTQATSQWRGYRRRTSRRPGTGALRVGTPVREPGDLCRGSNAAPSPPWGLVRASRLPLLPTGQWPSQARTETCQAALAATARPQESNVRLQRAERVD